MKNKIKKMSGFTLFEMLVVISIIAILTATISLSFSASQKKARDSRRIEDMKMLQSAFEQYYSQKGYKYPISQSELTTSGILPFFPNDPKTASAYICGWDNPNRTGYCCCATMENAGSGNANSSTTSNNPVCSFSSTNNNFFCIQNQQ